MASASSSATVSGPSLQVKVTVTVEPAPNHDDKPEWEVLDPPAPVLEFAVRTVWLHDCPLSRQRCFPECASSRLSNQGLTQPAETYIVRKWCLLPRLAFRTLVGWAWQQTDHCGQQARDAPQTNSFARSQLPSSLPLPLRLKPRLGVWVTGLTSPLFFEMPRRSLGVRRAASLAICDGSSDPE